MDKSSSLLSVAALSLALLALVPFHPIAHAKDAPYIATDDFTALAMLKMADVGPGDIVYDLGSGEGKLVIAAAKEKGARAVGVEIDPALIEKARENAATAGVEDLVRFEEGDLFEADISSATVVTLYLLQAVNLRLRPKLLAELKPGTRVVSNDFHMGDWKPAKQERLGSRTIYSWVIPERAAPPPEPSPSPSATAPPSIQVQ